MSSLLSEIIEVRMQDGLLSAWLQWPGQTRPQPGKYLLGRSDPAAEPIPCVLYPCGWQPGRMRVSGIPAHWNVGQPIQLRGLLGNGFSLPIAARRVALAALNDTPLRLNLLLQAALTQGAAVVLYCAHVPYDLPDEVEVLPLNQLAEAPAWADYLALEMADQQARQWRALFHLPPHSRLGCSAEALVVTSMPCGGLAECGLCSVETRTGWKHACKDGPVFELEDLLDG